MNQRLVETGAFRKSFKAFTLVELLVVVAIIALLVSILLPSLGRAKEQARIAVCLTNVRNIGSAFDLYINESDGWYPQGTGWGGTVGMRSWDMVLQPFYENYGVLHCPSDNAARPWRRNWNDRYWCSEITEEEGRYARSYAGNYMVVGKGGSEYGDKYPESDNGEGPDTWPEGPGSNPYSGSSHYPWPAYRHNVSEVEMAADTVLLSEMWESFYHPGDSGYAQEWIPNHYSQYWGATTVYYDSREGRRTTFYHHDEKSANFLFCDGHAATLPKNHPNLSDDGDSYYWLLGKP